MRTKGTAAELEVRRRIAGRLILQGKKLQEVADLVGVSLSSVKRWKRLMQQGGLEGLAVKRPPGKTPKLNAQQKQQLVKILLAGPLESGYLTDLWTCERVGVIIEENFGVKYHPAHVWRVLTKLKFSCQKPERKAREQDPKALAHWREQRWPELKKGLTSNS